MLYRPAGPQRPPTAVDADALARALDSLCAAPVVALGAAADGIGGGGGGGPTTAAANPFLIRAHVAFLKQMPARPPDPQVIARPVFMADLWAVTLAELPGRTFLLQRRTGAPGGVGGGGGGASAGGGASLGGGGGGVARPRGVGPGPRLAEVDDTARALLERRCEYRARGAVTVRAQAWRTRGGNGDGGGDVRLRLLDAVAPGSPTLALAVEVEYAPAASLEQAAPLLEELAAVLQKAVQRAAAAAGAAAGAGAGPAASASSSSARLELLRPPYADFVAAAQLIPGAYGPGHAALAYAELVALAQQQQGSAAS